MSKGGMGDGSNIIQYFDINLNIAHESLPTEKCPYCKNKGFLKILAVIHMVSEEAPVHSFNGSTMFNKEHIKFGFMCEESSVGYNKHNVRGSLLYPKQFSNSPQAVTCWDCLKAYGAKEKKNQLILLNR
ncbi:MAG: hypothetical protein ACTSVR_08380 [Candidatus Thorarchaeota archaeon]